MGAVGSTTSRGTAPEPQPQANARQPQPQQPYVQQAGPYYPGQPPPPQYVRAPYPQGQQQQQQGYAPGGYGGQPQPMAMGGGGGGPRPSPQQQQPMTMMAAPGQGGGGGIPGGGNQHVTYLTPEQMQALFLTGQLPGAAAHGAAFFSPYGILPHMLPPLPPPRVEHAQTIRNDINVKKGTMRLLEEPSPSPGLVQSTAASPFGGDGARGRLFLEFTFDAAAPCAITVLYCVEEVSPKPQGAPLTSVFRSLRPPHSSSGSSSSSSDGIGTMAVRRVYPKGLGQKYSQALGYGSSNVHGTIALPSSAGLDPASHTLGYLQPSAYRQNELTATGQAVQLKPPQGGGGAAAGQLTSHFYPVIVILEAVGEGEKEGDSRIVNPHPSTGQYFPWSPPQPGGAAGSNANTSGRVQLQVTYATLVHHPNATAAAATASSTTSAAGGTPSSLQPSRTWTVRPLKQKIAVDSDRIYELREIYGVDGSSSSAAPSSTAAADGAGGGGGGRGGDKSPAASDHSSSAAADGMTASAGAASSSSSSAAAAAAAAALAAVGGERDGHTESVLSSSSECVICLTEPRDTTVIPCRHMCLCYECALQLRLNTNRCPICRARE